MNEDLLGPGNLSPQDLFKALPYSESEFEAKYTGSKGFTKYYEEVFE